MSQPSNNPLFERLLDKQLSGPERDKVLAAVKADPKAVEQVRLQQRINESLARSFAPGEARAVPMAPARRPRALVWGLAAAAAVVLGLVGLWATFLRGGDASPLGSVYKAQLAGGFKPDKVCTTSEEFAEWVKTYYGQALYPAEPHEGVEFVGWNYAKAVGGNSGVLLAKVKGKEVIMVVDRKILDKSPFTSAGDPSLHSFRKEFGRVVAYEVTPWEQPAILPILSEKP